MLPDPFEELEQVLKTGLDPRDEVIQALSQLEGPSLERFNDLWRSLEPEPRAVLIDRLGEAAEENLALDFLPIYRVALFDVDPEIREMAFRLAADDAKPDLLETYLRAAVADPEPGVRLAALEGLGSYTLVAQIEGWPRDKEQQLEIALTGMLHQPAADLATRRMALLSLAYLTTEVAEAEIRQASFQPDLRATAIKAMGRNCQDVWIEDILAALEEDDPDLRLAAAAAAAEMEDERMVPVLVAHARDPDDEDLRLAAIEALAAIGREDAQAALTELAEGRDRAVREAAQRALQTLRSGDNPFAGLEV